MIIFRTNLPLKARKDNSTEKNKMRNQNLRIY